MNIMIEGKTRANNTVTPGTATKDIIQTIDTAGSGDVAILIGPESKAPSSNNVAPPHHPVVKSTLL